jgi:hypothetical protein
MASDRTTFERARRGYDEERERALVEAVTKAIFDTYYCTDARVVALRTGEAASALLTVLASILAMSPAATRSPTAMRNMLDELGKRLRRRLADAEQSEEMEDFLRRVFRSTDVGGRA